MLISCEPRPSNEMEAMGQDVLKAKSGLQFTIEPFCPIDRSTAIRPKSP